MSTFFGQKLQKSTKKDQKTVFLLSTVMVNYEQWSWPDQTLLPDLEKSHQSGKKALPEMEKKLPKSAKKGQKTFSL